MGRLAGGVSPGVPHYVVQQGKRPPLGDDAFVERLVSPASATTSAPANPTPSPEKRQGSREIGNMSPEPEIGNMSPEPKQPTRTRS